MPKPPQSPFKRLWTIPRTAANGPFLASARVNQIDGVIAAVTLALAPAACLSSVFLHRPSLVSAALVVVAVKTASTAVRGAFRIRLAMHLGRWIGWKKEPIWRSEQPTRYRYWTAIHAAIVAVYSAVAVFLIWSIWAGWLGGK